MNFKKRPKGWKEIPSLKILLEKKVLIGWRHQQFRIFLENKHPRDSLELSDKTDHSKKVKDVEKGEIENLEVGRIRYIYTLIPISSCAFVHQATRKEKFYLIKQLTV